MDLTEEYIKDMEKKLELMKAFLNGKTLQFKEGYLPEECWKTLEGPLWDFLNYDYRIKPEEPEEPKKLMTNRQLAELMAKGYGELRYRHNLLVKTHFRYDINNEDKPKNDVVIRPWGSDEWLEPTVDIYEEYVSKWNRAFSWANDVPKGENKSEPIPQDCQQSSGIKDYSDAGHREAEPSIGERFLCKGKLYECIECNDCDRCAFSDVSSCYAFNCNKRKDGKSVVFVDVSKMENTTSEESSSTVSKEEMVGVHRRTPQEIADFFNCYVAMSGKNEWLLYEKEPCIVNDHWSSYYEIFYLGYKSNCFFLLAPEDHNWRTLYRPHMEPLVKEEEDD